MRKKLRYGFLMPKECKAETACGPSPGTAPPGPMMAGQQRQDERHRFLWFWVLGNHPHVKGTSTRKLLVVALAASPCQGQDEQGGAQDAKNQAAGREVRR